VYISLGSKIPIPAGPVLDLARNTVYICTSHSSPNEGRIFAYRIDNLSASVWPSYHALPAGVAATPALAADGALLVPCVDGKLYALNPDDGSEKWVFDPNVEGLFASPTVDGDGKIYLTTMDFTLYALDPSGAIIWNCALRGHVTAPPVLNGNGALYLATQCGSLLELKEKSASSGLWHLYQ